MDNKLRNKQKCKTCAITRVLAHTRVYTYILNSAWEKELNKESALSGSYKYSRTSFV